MSSFVNLMHVNVRLVQYIKCLKYRCLKAFITCNEYKRKAASSILIREPTDYNLKLVFNIYLSITIDCMHVFLMRTIPFFIAFIIYLLFFSERKGEKGLIRNANDPNSYTQSKGKKSTEFNFNFNFPPPCTN